MPERTLAVTCIDWRKAQQSQEALEEQDLKNGDYHLLSTAGAARNPDTINRINLPPTEPPFDSVINESHLDCAFGKKAGDDSVKAHEDCAQQLGKDLKEKSPDIKYSYQILPIREGDLEKHDCQAVAIILGKPEIVKAAREELKKLGVSESHDEIARPFMLSADDETIFGKNGDLQISLELHHPTIIYIFDESEENAMILMEKAKKIAEHIEIEPRVISIAA